MGAPKRRRSRLARTVRLTSLMAWSADPGSFCLMIGLALVPAAIPPVVVVMGKHLVDLVAEAHFRGTSASALVPTVVALGVLTALQRGLNSILASRQELFARRVYLEAERRFLAQAATVDLGHFDDSDWHDRVARASRDVSHRPANLTWTAINVGGNLVTSIGMLGILASLNPLLVALVAFSVVPNVLIQKRMTARLYAFWWDETPEDRERVYLGELLHLPRTAKELRSFHLGPHLADRHNRLGLRQYERMRRLYRAYEATSLIISVVSGLTIALAYGWSPTGGSPASSPPATSPPSSPPSPPSASRSASSAPPWRCLTRTPPSSRTTSPSSPCRRCSRCGPTPSPCPPVWRRASGSPTSTSATRARTRRRCRASSCGSGPGSWWRWSARTAPARPAWSSS